MNDAARATAGVGPAHSHSGARASDLRRSPAAWRLAWRVLRLVLWVRWSLWRRPYARVRAELVRRRVGRGAPPPIRGRSGDLARDPRALAWAVRAAARRVPKASCLTQSLALETLLLQAGHPAELRIGVARGAAGGFEAHAWVELDGQVMIGRLPDLHRFAVLPVDSESLDPA